MIKSRYSARVDIDNEILNIKTQTMFGYELQGVDQSSVVNELCFAVLGKRQQKCVNFAYIEICLLTHLQILSRLYHI